MDAIPFQEKLEPRYTLGIVGGAMTLAGVYHPDQLWFSFMAGSAIRMERPASQPRTHTRRSWNVNGYAKAAEFGRTLYSYIKGVEQRQLVFPDTRCVSKNEYSRLQQAHFAGWDKPGGKPIVFAINPDTHKDARKWCVENLKGRFHIKPNLLSIQLAEDALMARIFWQVGK